MKNLECKNPVFFTPSNTQILLDWNHPTFGWIEFLADPTDVEAHGREIFAKAIAGEFGPVGEYVGLVS